MSQIFLHVGYPKTATTTLQEGVFQKNSELVDLSHAVRVDGRVRCFSLFDGLTLHNKKVIISDERLLDPRGDFVDNIIRLEENMSRLSADIDILFTIRNQKDLLKSAFTFWNAFFKRKGYNDLDFLVEKEINSKNRITNLKEWLNFYNVIKEYSERFGRENINILKYEELKYDKDLFTNKLSSIMGIDRKECIDNLENTTSRNVQSTNNKHRKPSWLYWKISTIKSRLFPNSPPASSIPFGSAIKNTLSKLNRKVTFDSSSLRVIKNEYGESNRKMFKEFELEEDDHYF